MSDMTLNDVRRIVQKARDESRIPDLRCADLRCADLSSADLSSADLRGADLYGANLYGADLSSADLYGANLYGANLSSANLYGADLCDANLYGANLSRADLYGANLSSADGWSGLQITGLHSYQIQLAPTHEGWSITIECWTGTPDQLADLITQDDGWPESKGSDIPRNRTLLEAALTVIHAHIDAHPEAVTEAAEAHKKWQEGTNA